MILKDFIRYNRYYDTEKNEVIEQENTMRFIGWYHKDEVGPMKKLYTENNKLFFETDIIKIELTKGIKVEHKHIMKIDNHSVKKELLVYKIQKKGWLCKTKNLIYKMYYIAEFGYIDPILENEFNTNDIEDWGLFLSILIKENRISYYIAALNGD